MRRKFTSVVLLIVLLTSCTRAANAPVWTPYAPPTTQAVSTAEIVLTFLPPTRAPGTQISTPTPDEPVDLIIPTITQSAFVFGDTPTPGPFIYTVQEGDYLGSIAQEFDIGIEDLMSANNITSLDEVIYPGQELIIPGKTAGTSPDKFSGVSSNFKVIPDSELINSPLTTLLNVGEFAASQGGYLAFYTQDVDGETLNGAQILERVAENYSVNPRLLLAVLEYRSQWVTNANPAPSTLDTPIGYVDDFHVGLYRQLTWTADKLNEGFYRWKLKQIDQFTLADGSIVGATPAINAGTAGVQNLFSYLDETQTWLIDVGPSGVFATYSNLFGYPFDFAVENLVPANLTQPVFSLPFNIGETWSFTGGPHGGWDSGSGFAALDFAPPGEPQGCAVANVWVLAITDGLIVRSRNGQVLQDLDGDGLTQTGWNVLYMHINELDRVPPGTFVRKGERIGHPSCEGGFANATHLHIARKYNGQWIPADDPNVPFVLDDWLPSGNGYEYDGWLTKGDFVIEAVDGYNVDNPINQITR
jgi:LysM repeat protein